MSMHIFQQSKEVLGTEAMLTIVAGEAEEAEKIFYELWEYIDAFDQSFSRFLPASELSELNLRAGERVEVTDKFLELLKASKKMAGATNSLFNPFILPALQKAGYKKSWVDPNREGPDFSQRRVATPDELLISGNTIQIPSDSALDSGGIGKGYLLDRLGELLVEHRVKNYWISLGGDILVSGQMDDGNLWEIDIASAEQADSTKATVIVPLGGRIAIATSGTTKRAGVHNGKKWHHIIDPTTGEPIKSDILTATVCMPNGVQADVFASCIVALGSKHYEAFMKKHKIKDVIIQTDSNQVYRSGSLIRSSDAN